MDYYLAAFKKYATFQGRARRKEYWMFFLFNCLIYFGIGLVGSSELVLLYYLVVLIPSIAVAVRRMHDVGKSGWFVLIPIYNFILAITEGNRGENEYGPDPKTVENLN
jgi:uncharacterized membrane protein YhaH (DUF805 family)